jgi:hypothetical protein
VRFRAPFTDRNSEEGKIKSTDNPITNILPEFKTKQGLRRFTIKTYCNTSGIKFSDQI